MKKQLMLAFILLGTSLWLCAMEENVEIMLQSLTITEITDDENIEGLEVVHPSSIEIPDDSAIIRQSKRKKSLHALNALSQNPELLQAQKDAINPCMQRVMNYFLTPANGIVILDGETRFDE